MLVNAVCVLNNDRFLEPYGIGFSYLDSGASHVSLKSNIIHAIKWIQVIRTPLIPLNLIIIFVKLIFG
eukprot:g7259.t1